MAKKNNGGVADWHKQQRKKQVQKNKEARISARDARVVQEKSSGHIRDEIRALERQYKNAEQRPHAIQSKLDRLQKELKLVTAAAKAAAIQNESSTTHNAAANSAAAAVNAFVPLENPAVSIYYDAVLNPYGAPPPGQPRLYHRRGGGRTWNLAEACAPHEQFLPPPPPPPPPPPLPPPQQGRQHQQQHGRQQQYTNSSSQGQRNPHAANSNQHRHHHQQHQPRSKPSVPPPPTLPVDDSVQKPSKPATKAENLSPQLPALPPPSFSVQRCVQKSSFDIWASTEEEDYYEQQQVQHQLEAESSLLMEGARVAPADKPSCVRQQTSTDNAATTHAAKTNDEPEGDDTNKSLETRDWHYIDTSGTAQGPYSIDQMQSWIQAGFFPPSTRVAASSSVADGASTRWTELGDVPELIGGGSNETGLLLQDRIASLRESQEQPLDEPHPQSTVENRIAALRRERLLDEDSRQHQPTEDSHVAEEASEYEKVNDPDEAHSTVNARIAALRAGQVKVKGYSPNPSHEEMDVRRRIDTLRSSHRPLVSAIDSNSDNSLLSTVPLPPPPPPPMMQEGASHHETYDVAPYSLNDDEQVAPYTIVDESMNNHRTNEAETDAGELSHYMYPTEELGDVPYPVDYENDDGEYPVTGSYVDGLDTGYPVTEAYDDYSEGEHLDNNNPTERSAERTATETGPPKKKLKVNKDIVALLPSHLHKRKSAVRKIV